MRARARLAAFVLAAATLVPLGLTSAQAGGSNETSNSEGSWYAINVWTKSWCKGTHYVLKTGNTRNGIKSYKVNAYSTLSRNYELSQVPMRDPDVCVNVNTQSNWTWTIVRTYSNA